jgi:hypothetical protein
LNIYLQVLQLLRKAPLTVRYTICQQVLEMLYNSPHHVSDIAQSHGWESLFLWQLTPNQEAPTVATPVVVQFEPRESVQPRNGEGEGGGENGGSSYKKIESNMDAAARVERLPSVAEWEGEDPRIKSENGQDKNNRIEEESSTNVTTNENGGGPPVPSIAVTPDHDSSTCIVHAQGEGEGEEEGEWGGDSDTRYRSRSKAIVNPPNTTRNSSRPISISPTSNLGASSGGSKNLQHGHAAQKKGHGKKRGSLTYSKCWDDETMEESDDIWRTCNIVTETVAYILWRSTDNHADRPPWKVQEFFT